MKEIIYLDTDIMNSLLAQIDEGLIDSFSIEDAKQTSETTGQQASKGKSAGVKGQLRLDTGWLPGGGVALDGSLGNTGNETTHDSKTFLEGARDILNKAFHDHALNILLQKLDDLDLIEPYFKLNDGDIYLGESSYKYYNFELIKNMTDVKILEKIFLMDITDADIDEARRLVQKSNPNAKERIRLDWARKVVQKYDSYKPTLDIITNLNNVSKYFSTTLGNSSFIKADNFIGIVKKQYLRESPEALSLRVDQTREVKFLVRIIGKKGKVFDGMGHVEDLKAQDFNLVPNMFFDIILGSFNILEEGDFLVTPIAIYYE
ncbi:hypothetical protein U9M49_21160 [Cytobacillus sp. OWB-43]|uniref:DUF6414 family protein n=1 Tax=Cytobacillus sp. OWB-43 TaxID=3108468 RepID=UPI002AFE6391|nr:hypothetical protein [Cytobacillus sp. OWB-43]MEA1855575.1 hypothetical protein [Cytobacillus sp. OWB-43]